MPCLQVTIPEEDFEIIANLANATFRNVWFSVSVESQIKADDRVPNLLARPAGVRFKSRTTSWACKRQERRSLKNELHSTIASPKPVCKQHLIWVIAGGDRGETELIYSA